MKQAAQESSKNSVETRAFLQENAPISQLLQLFEQHAQELRFPDLDAQLLSSTMEEIEEKQQSVEAAEEALAEARDALALLQQAMLEKAQKAHAYASVYAMDKPELQEALQKIKLGAGAGSAARKRRPLIRKARPVETGSSSGSDSSSASGSSSANDSASASRASSAAGGEESGSAGPSEVASASEVAAAE